MGQVWRASHRVSGHPAAVKLLTDRRTHAERFRSLLRHEARAVAALAHPNVIAIYDHGTVPPGTDPFPEGSPYLVMEWAGGGSLFPRLPLVRWADVREVLVATLEALAHAHARGVLHRDLKPGNLLRTDGPDARWTLADFGIARIGEGDQSASAGTHAYMAPEQVRGAEAEQGPWTDLYALGCLAWELTTGAPPFLGDPDQVRAAHLGGALPRWAPAHDIPEGVEAWLLTLLQRDPVRRYAFAADALDALRRADTPAARPWSDTDFELAPDPSGRTRAPLPDDWRPEPAVPVGLPLNSGAGLVGLRPIPFEGREAERDGLWASLSAVVRSGRGGLVVVTGPSGVGKTRLATWLGTRAQELGVARWTRVRFASDAPGALLERGLHAHLAHPEPADGVRPIAERLPAVHALLAEATLDRGLVLILDDVHQAPAEVELVRRLYAGEGVDVPVLAVVTASEEVLAEVPAARAAVDALLAVPGVERLTLAPLPEAHQRRLVERLLSLDPALVAEVVERTDGNPRFAEQLVRAWIEGDALVPGRFGFRLRRRVPPLDADGVWRARIERLLDGEEPDAGHSLELGAVLGLRVVRGEWRDACAAAHVDPRPDLVERMHELRLVRAEARGDWVYTHARVREALVERARDAGRLPGWHSACARVLAREGADPERVGRHRRRAGDLRGAAGPLLAAARVRRRAGDIGESLALLEVAEECLRDAPIPPEDPRWGDLWVERCEALRLRGEFAAAEEVVSVALDQARRHHWRDARAVLLFNRAEIARLQGRVEDAEALARAAVDAARTCGPHRLLPALGSLGLALRARGDFAGAEQVYLEAQALPNEDAHLEILVHLLLANLYSDLWRLGPSLEAARKAAELARRHGLLLNLGPALGTVARTTYQTGDLEAAEARYREAAAAYRAISHAFTPLAELNLARTLWRRGKADEARELLGRWSHRLSPGDAPLLLCLHHLLRAALDLELSTLTEFEAHFGAAEAVLARLEKGNVDLAEVAGEIADAALAVGRVDRARRATKFVREQARRTGEKIPLERAAGLEARLRAGR